MVRLLEVESQLYDGLNYISATIQKNTVRHPYFYHLKGNFLMHHVQFQKAIAEFKKANALFKDSLGELGFSFTSYNIGLCY